MRKRVFAAAGASAALVVGLLTGTAAAQPSLTDQINGLEVTAEQTADYPGRDGLNVNYDRDAVLSSNQSAFGDCDGYFSRYDATCHGSEDAVQIDHVVSVREAWDSGLRGESAWEEFDGDTSNLAVMTSGLNQSKGAADAAGWTPSNATCHFTESYVSTKDQYGLTVNEAEKNALLDLASSCNGGGGDDGGDGGDDKDDESEDEAPKPDPVEGDLEVTG